MKPNGVTVKPSTVDLPFGYTVTPLLLQTARSHKDRVRLTLNSRRLAMLALNDKGAAGVINPILVVVKCYRH